MTQQVHWANNLVFYSHSVETAPRNLTMLNNLGSEFVERGDAERATVVFQRVLARDPQHWFANSNMGYLTYRQGRYLDAERYLGAAVDAQPTDADSFAHLGMTELQLNHLEAAQTHLERALALRPDGYGFHEALALVLAARGDATGSRRQLQAELAQHPANLHARKALEALDKP